MRSDFLTNLRPSGMTLGINEALVLSFSTAMSSKSRSLGPLLPNSNSLAPSLARSYLRLHSYESCDIGKTRKEGPEK